MGAGDRFMQKSFSVPMTGKGTWPFPPKAERAYCPTCDRPEDACDCPVLATETGEGD